jgi:hypothetical protein
LKFHPFLRENANYSRRTFANGLGFARSLAEACLWLNLREVDHDFRECGLAFGRVWPRPEEDLQAPDGQCTALHCTHQVE